MGEAKNSFICLIKFSPNDRLASGIIKICDFLAETVLNFQKNPNDRKMVKEVVDPDDFKALISQAAAEGKLLVVDFHAQWCGPCKMIAPKIVKMADELKDVCLFAKVDVDEAQEISEEYEIQAMPTFLCFANGVKVGTVTGANEQKVREMITKHSL